MAISYPESVLARLRDRGKFPEPEARPAARAPSVPAHPAIPSDTAPAESLAVRPPPKPALTPESLFPPLEPRPVDPSRSSQRLGTPPRPPVEVPGPTPRPPSPAAAHRTPPHLSDPVEATRLSSGAAKSATKVDPRPAARPQDLFPALDAPIEAPQERASAQTAATAPAASPRLAPPSTTPPIVAARAAAPPVDVGRGPALEPARASVPAEPAPLPAPTRPPVTRADIPAPPPPPRSRTSPGSEPRRPVESPPTRRWPKVLGGIAIGIGVVALAGLGAGYQYFGRDLPSIERLQAYEPATVTVVYDRNGKLMGEIYDERRYVVPLSKIPEHVKQAFIAAEDANFYSHSGVDYFGIIRAMGRNALEGRMAQGASTITQQVTRNFLLNKDKNLERKVKEILLSWRIEQTYDKDHILYLYLNEIYLGSHAYGVEAAARTYFGKNIDQVTLAEAALLAGLPQRPSDYSPHRHIDKAKFRQRYVLDQMVRNGYIQQQQADDAHKAELTIIEKENPFLEMAPHFTEHVRRYLVEKFGEDRVLREGLQVTTTCDLDLQTHAQQTVAAGVREVDERMGFRRANVQTLATDGEIAKVRAAHEQDMREQWAREQDAAGRVEPPAKSVIEPGRVYPAIILEVGRTWARVAVGDHEGIIPMRWSDWVYPPDPSRSWRNREQDDFLRSVDGDGDGKKDGGILRKGDVVEVEIAALDTGREDVKAAFVKTPGAQGAMLALRLRQQNDVEAALLSMDLASGAVRAMVGGSDFKDSQLNRATQSRRQIGSTFKPFVYAAAIESKKITAATVIADAPIAFETENDFIWKPQNYGNDYLGNITLRRALVQSRNTVTVRVMEQVDPGLNNDLVYKFARRMGLGGEPVHRLAEGAVVKPENDWLCPWVRETQKSTICMDRLPPKDPNVTNTAHRRRLKPEDVYMCRACDFSMGLGSAAISMPELLRGYAVFPNNGLFVEPYYVEEVKDRQGKVLEKHAADTGVQVVDPKVAAITRWLLEGVVDEGTATLAKQKLQMHIGGKTGTTNDEKDAWFVGFTPDVISAVWVGFDQPRTLGASSTGGRTALPIWIDYMRVASPKEQDREFPNPPDLEWALIDDWSGRRRSDWGRQYPFLPGTVPAIVEVQPEEVTLEELATEL
jgi:penicillin-binding protein 1A